MVSGEETAELFFALNPYLAEFILFLRRFKKMKKWLSLILAVSFIVSAFAGCGEKPDENSSSMPDVTIETSSSEASSEPSKESTDLTLDHTMELKYAELFKVDYLSDGFKLLTVDDKENYKAEILLVPEGKEAPKKSSFINENTIILNAPLNNMLVSSTPVVSLINAFGSLDTVTMSTYEADSWYIDEVKNATEDGKIKYVGHYKEPDFEMIAAEKPDFAIFSTMLQQVPEVEAKLKELGVKILLDQSSSEAHPMARTEWMMFYAALLNKETEAEKEFEKQCEVFEAIKTPEGEKENAVIFYITSKNVLHARRGGDYMAKMLELAGGEYIFADVEPNKTGTVKMDFETFYDKAKDADNIIYVWSLGGKPETLGDFTAKNELFKDLKAVKEGNVWCTTPDYFQRTNVMGDMISEFNKVLTMDEVDESKLQYLFKLK